jgi:hypothetical protein
MPVFNFTFSSNAHGTAEVTAENEKDARQLMTEFLTGGVDRESSLGDIDVAVGGLSYNFDKDKNK